MMMMMMMIMTHVYRQGLFVICGETEHIG